MESRYIEGKPIPPFDQMISEFLADGGSGGRNHMMVGIENLYGDVYRVIRTTGMGEYISVVNFLASIGLEDALADSLSSTDGFDSRFTVPTQLREEFAGKSARSSINPVNPFAEIAAAKEELSLLDETERDSVIQSRIGQGLFRTRLIQYWGQCAVTGCPLVQLLRASPVKPWHCSNNAERLDMYNGLLLLPNLDVAFDMGLITFDEGGRIVISPRVSQQVAYTMHLGGKLRIKKSKLTEDHKGYLAYHRAFVYECA